ncbi:hypothetical protein GCM10010404_13170 [Nonomuraea africana]
MFQVTTRTEAADRPAVAAPAGVEGSRPAPAATVAAAALVRNRSRREKGDTAFSFGGWYGNAGERAAATI